MGRGKEEAGVAGLGNLPARITAFVGRESDLDQLRQLLAGYRLVTLTGAGGCGKTRLALELAARVAGAFPDGAWWVELGGVEDDALVVPAVEVALPGLLGASAQPGTRLIEGLRAARLLIVLDNCEHVSGACGRLADALLPACPAVRILCTSRQPLDVDGEVVWRVPPLAIPPAGVIDPGAVAEFESVQLFIERASRRRPSFALDAGNALAVADICRRLDGLPLAIELVAAGASSMTFDQINEAVAQHLMPLASSSPGRPPRHQTLEASIAWSHDLLSPEEQAVFRRLGAFYGSFSMSGAVRVCGWPPVEDSEILRLLGQLVDRSMVHFEEALGGRYRLLETVRHFAVTRLEAVGEVETTRHRHLDFCLGVGESAAAALETDAASAQLELLEAQRDDMISAIKWAVGSGRLDDARTLAAQLLIFWMARYPSEGLALLEAVADGEGGEPAAQARAQSAAAWLALYGPFDASLALDYGRRALATAREAGCDEVVAAALNHLAWASLYAAPAEAGRHFEEAVVLHERRGDLPRLAHALAGRGFIAVQDGAAGDARRWLAQSLQVARQAGDEIGIRRALAFLGSVSALHGDLKESELLLADCLERARRLRDRYFVAHSLDYLGLSALHRGELEAAATILGEALATSRLSSPLALARTLVHLAHLAVVSGDFDAARARLAAAPEGNWGLNWYLARKLPLLAEISILEEEMDAADERVRQALALAQGPDRPWALALARTAQGRLLRSRGSLPQATAAAHEALAALVRIGHRPDALDTLELLAGLRCDAGHPEESARLLGAAESDRARSGLRRPAVHEAEVRSTASTLDELLGVSAGTLRHAGAALSLDDALAYASRGRGERRRPAAGWESMTPSEHTVAELVAGGLTNGEIARRLFISPATVRAHLGHIYTKLGIRSRTQLAVYATRQGDERSDPDTRGG